jgi:hypothetical protein
MSFDIYVIRAENGEAAPIPIAIIEQAFGPFIEFREPAGWGLLFPDGRRSFLYLREGERNNHFSINRPASSPELWAALFQILRQTGSVLYWPGGGSVVADETVIPHLTPDILRSLEPAMVVRSPSEIVDCIERS